MELGETARRDNVRISDVLQIAWNALSENFLSWLVISIVFIIAGWGGMLLLQGLMAALLGGGFAGIGDAGAEPNLGLLAGAMAGNFLAGSVASVWLGLLSLGYWGAAVRGALGLSVGVGDVFAQFRKFLKYIIQTFLIQSINGVFAIAALTVFAIALLDMIDITTILDLTFAELQNYFDGPLVLALFKRAGWVVLLLTLPFVYIALGLFFAQLELAYNDDSGPISSIANSWRIASKHRLQMIGLSLLIGICFIVGVLTCGLGLIVVIPFSSLSFAALYLALRNGANVDPPDTTTTLRGDTRPRPPEPFPPDPSSGGGGDVAPVHGDDAPRGTWS